MLPGRVSLLNFTPQSEIFNQTAALFSLIVVRMCRKAVVAALWRKSSCEFTSLCENTPFEFEDQTRFHKYLYSTRSLLDVRAALLGRVLVVGVCLVTAGYGGRRLNV